MAEIIRTPVCAGMWYPVSKEEIKKYININSSKTDAIACICPHAGWIYSGNVAGEVYSKLNNYDTYIIIGPNHTGAGPDVSIFSEGIWKMPLKNVEIDTEIANNILKISEFAEQDLSAHIREHCIEVQIPFLQYFNVNFKIVPIILKTDVFEVCVDLANAIYTGIKNIKKRILIIASTDMTHYETLQYAKLQDNFAIEKILQLNAEGLVNVVLKKGISMCGVFPTATTILVAEKLGAETVQLIKYSTSGDITGDYDSVVSYAGFIIK